MIFMLGHLTLEQIEHRIGITLSDEHREELSKMWQDDIDATPLGEGRWHGFDIPLIIVADTKKTAFRIRDIFIQYEPSKWHESLQITWEKE